MARKEIVLEGVHWRSQADFYDAFFLAVGSPKSHARNFDALADSVCGGQINAVDIPYTLVIRGYERMQEAARRFVDRVCRILLELQAEGCDVDVRCE
ncbi:MAG: barstar family protein [Candidatus Rokubacteria bacterium]|nr:barstar family protein [Candidatus Rokubacteria bacterium]